VVGRIGGGTAEAVAVTKEVASQAPTPSRSTGSLQRRMTTEIRRATQRSKAILTRTRMATMLEERMKNTLKRSQNEKNGRRTTVRRNSRNEKNHLLYEGLQGEGVVPRCLLG